QRGCGAFRIRERVRDRHAHVRVAEVRERRAVAEADERVHDRGRLDRHLDALIVYAEQEVGLDHLEYFVRKRGGVHRALRPHAPRGVGEGVRGRHVFEVGARAAAEWAAGAGQYEGVDLFGLASLETLEQRRVLAVHGKDPAATALARGESELSGGHQALLVR